MSARKACVPRLEICLTAMAEPPVAARRPGQITNAARKQFIACPAEAHSPGHLMRENSAPMSERPSRRPVLNDADCPDQPDVLSGRESCRPGDEVLERHPRGAPELRARLHVLPRA